MNIFSPYQVIEQTNCKLHLQLPKWRKRMQLFFFRVFPFLLLGLTSPIIFYAEDMPMGMLYLVIISVVIIAFVLFFKKYPIEVDITHQSIRVVVKTVGSISTKTYPITEIDSLTCKIRHGKYGGTFFSAKMKTGGKVQFMEIPVLNMKRENTDEIIAVLEQITGLKTTMDLPLFGR